MLGIYLTASNQNHYSWVWSIKLRWIDNGCNKRCEYIYKEEARVLQVNELYVETLLYNHWLIFNTQKTSRQIFYPLNLSLISRFMLWWLYWESWHLVSTIWSRINIWWYLDEASMWRWGHKASPPVKIHHRDFGGGYASETCSWGVDDKIKRIKNKTKRWYD